VPEVERALFLNNLDTDLLDTGEYSRLYFGSEFCPWTFPEPGTICNALEEAHRAGCAFTLATPVICEAFLPRLRETLNDVHPLLRDDDEVLVSDLGGIAVVREIAPSVAIVLGRVLSGQKRGPRILDLELNPDQLDYFRQGSWYSTEGARLLSEIAISRVELDNLLQGIASLPEGLKGSLHYPYAMVTSSRNCPFRETNSAQGCGVLCGEVFRLETPQSSVPLLQGGNTQFLRNEILPDDPAEYGIDRLVFHPRLPR